MFAAPDRPVSFEGRGAGGGGVRGGGGRGGKARRVSSRVHEQQFCGSRVTKQIIMFSRFIN